MKMDELFLLVYHYPQPLKLLIYRKMKCCAWEYGLLKE